MSKTKSRRVGWLYSKFEWVPQVTVDWVPGEGLFVAGQALGVGVSGTYLEAVESVFVVYHGSYYGLRLSSAAFRALRTRYCLSPAGGYTKGGLGRDQN